MLNVQEMGTLLRRHVSTQDSPDRFSRWLPYRTDGVTPKYIFGYPSWHKTIPNSDILKKKKTKKKNRKCSCHNFYSNYVRISVCLQVN